MGGVIQIIDSNLQLGAWLSRSKNTVYQAATDGFVVGHIVLCDTIVELKSDGANPPVANRYSDQTNTHVDWCVPIKKDDYWEVTTIEVIDFMYWIPLNVIVGKPK